MSPGGKIAPSRESVFTLLLLSSASGGFYDKDQNLSPNLERQLWSQSWLGENINFFTHWLCDLGQVLNLSVPQFPYL